MSDEDQVHLPVETTDIGATIRVGNRSYHFLRTEEGTLVYSHNSPANLPEEKDDEPFDPSKYR
jgi:hypothetical protein